jgi:hypothetical protein
VRPVSTCRVFPSRLPFPAGYINNITLEADMHRRTQGEYDTLAPVGCCCVEMRGTDGQIHSTTLDATSLYDAAEKATQSWSMLWWFDANALVTVRHGEQSWTISQQNVRERRQGKK